MFARQRISFQAATVYTPTKLRVVLDRGSGAACVYEKVNSRMWANDKNAGTSVGSTYCSCIEGGRRRTTLLYMFPQVYPRNVPPWYFVSSMEFDLESSLRHNAAVLTPYL